MGTLFNQVLIGNKEYTLRLQYQHDEKLRLAFNSMTQEFWKFDFENYYQSGFWDGSCILYSLFDGNKIVSHTTVSLFDTDINGLNRKLIQIGTVMTDGSYQKQGLSRFLMERIAEEFRDRSDGMFLFANDTVLDFYPRFGFVPVSEFEFFQTINSRDLVQQYTKRKLNLDDKKDLSLFESLVEKAVPNSKFTTYNKGLSLFYCYAYPDMGYKETIYFIEALNCAVVAQIEGKVLQITEIFSPNEINMQSVMSTFADMAFEEVVFGFTPKQQIFECRTWKEEDLQLFVSPELRTLFEHNQLKVAALSHT